jgi:hypothetical protein
MLFCGVWYPAGLCFAGSDTLQNFVKRGIRPCRLLFCGVSDLAEQVSSKKCTQLCHCSAGSATPKDLVLCGLKPAGSCSAGSDTPQNFVLRGIRPRGTRRKSFESLPFSLKGHSLNIVCMHKPHYPRHIWFMLKEPPIWKTVFCSAGSDTPQNKFEYQW